VLNDTTISKLKPKDKAYKVGDFNGLYLFISPSGLKSWRYNYVAEGKAKTLTLGRFPLMKVNDARLKLAEAKGNIAVNLPPIEVKHTFKTLSDEFCKKQDWDEKHKQYRRLVLYCFPYFGDIPAESVPRKLILDCMRKIEAKGKIETAHRTLNLVSQILRYGVQCGYLENNQASELTGALKSITENHFAAVVEEKDFAAVLHKISAFNGSVSVTAALKLAPLLVVRPGELRSAKWKDFDFHDNEWRFFVTKTRQNHIVPLSKQALSIINELKQHNGDSEYLFPTPRSKTRCLSDAVLSAALKSLGITEQTAHGFRASFRTLAAERLSIPEHLLEHQLAHTVKDPLGRAYNRTSFIKERKEMMQRWSDYLDDLVLWF
jgi:integrase